MKQRERERVLISITQRQLSNFDSAKFVRAKSWAEQIEIKECQ